MGRRRGRHRADRSPPMIRNRDGKSVADDRGAGAGRHELPDSGGPRREVLAFLRDRPNLPAAHRHAGLTAARAAPSMR